MSRCVTNFLSCCPDGSCRTGPIPDTKSGCNEAKVVVVTSVLSSYCSFKCEMSYAYKSQNKCSILRSHQNTKQIHKNCVFCHLEKLKKILNVGICILNLQLTFTFIKSPVWQGKSPATGHEPDNKKCLICQPDLMFVTHLEMRLPIHGECFSFACFFRGI